MDKQIIVILALALLINVVSSRRVEFSHADHSDEDKTKEEESAEDYRSFSNGRYSSGANYFSSQQQNGYKTIRENIDIEEALQSSNDFAEDYQLEPRNSQRIETNILVEEIPKDKEQTKSKITKFYGPIQVVLNDLEQEKKIEKDLPQTNIKKTDFTTLEQPELRYEQPMEAERPNKPIRQYLQIDDNFRTTEETNIWPSERKVQPEEYRPYQPRDRSSYRRTFSSWGEENRMNNEDDDSSDEDSSE